MTELVLWQAAFKNPIVTTGCSSMHDKEDIDPKTLITSKKYPTKQASEHNCKHRQD